MTEQQKAEAYVREKLPELMELSFGCEVSVNGKIYTLDSDWGIATREEYDKSGYYQVIRNGMNDWTRIEEDHFKIIGHPIYLQHWLRVFEPLSVTISQLVETGNILVEKVTFSNIIQCQFNLTTGQPATEADYKAFNHIVGI